MRFFVAFVLLAVSSCSAQFANNSNTINISGDAEVKVVPDRVSVLLGVESRSKILADATDHTDAATRRIIAAATKLGIDATEIQTDYIHVDLTYDKSGNEIGIEYYTATKAMQILVKDTTKFQSLISDSLAAGANHIYGVDFSTSQLRKYRDQARAMAVKAAIEKAHDLASVAGLTVADKPLTVAAYSYGGGSYYGRCCGPYYGGQMYQNVSQNAANAGDNAGSDGSVALGKISVTASVTMTFQIH